MGLEVSSAPYAADGMRILVCISGPDGAGKSTQTRMLARNLSARGIRTRVVWLRYNHLFSLPVLGVARIRHLSRMVTYEGGYKVGYHHFSESRLISTAYEVTRIVDFLVAFNLKARLWTALGWTVISDRFFPDVLADLLLSTGRTNDFSLSVWRRIKSKLPPGSIVRILLAPPGALLTRRPDLPHDETLVSKVKGYEKLAAGLDIPVYDARDPPQAIQTRLLRDVLSVSRNGTENAPMGPRAAVLDRAKAHHARYIKDRRSSGRRRAPVVLGSSWLFQGLLYADRTEVVFKVLLDMLFFSLIAYALSGVMSGQAAAVLGLVFAHTLNWFCNGQPLVALKNLGVTHTPIQRFRGYLTELSKRIAQTDCLAYAAVYGSASRGELTVNSDIDVKAVRKRGVANGGRAMAFLMKERIRSTLQGVPLDIYVLDGFGRLQVLEPDQGLVLFDSKPTEP